MRHFEETSKGKSYLYGDMKDAHNLIRELKGTGELVRDSKFVWRKKERVISDRISGVYIDENGHRQETDKLMIVYSNTGSHIYPRREK